MKTRTTNSNSNAKEPHIYIIVLALAILDSAACSNAVDAAGVDDADSIDVAVAVGNTGQNVVHRQQQASYVACDAEHEDGQDGDDAVGDVDAVLGHEPG